MFLRCRHDDTSSFLLFKELISGWQIIRNFSCRHKLHLLVVLEYDLHWFYDFSASSIAAVSKT